MRLRSRLALRDEVSRRTGVPVTALRFYESKGLMAPSRATSGHRRYPRDTLRRVSFILAAQRVGLSLRDIQSALSKLPAGRTPTAADWSLLSASWRPMLEGRLRALKLLRDQLDDCIGCGCLSLETCALQNPDDRVASLGPGPRYLLGD